MKKRITSALLALTMLLTLSPLSAFAVEAEIVVYQEEEVYVPDTEGTPGNDELFAGYVERLLYADANQSQNRPWRAPASSRLSGTNLTIYNALKEQIRQVADGEITSTVFSIPYADLDWKSTYSYAELGLDTNPTGDAITKAVDNKLSYDRRAIVNALLADCPYELYWFDKTEGYSSLAYPSCSYGNQQVILLNNDGATPATALTFTFYVAQLYSKTGTKKTTEMKNEGIAALVQKVKDNAAKVVSDNSSKSDYEKLVAYKEYICEQVSYNTSAADDSTNTPYGDPWQLIYAFDENPSTNIVCEGYAKAFKYLCDLTTFNNSNIECYIVSGNMGGGIGAGGHMWNIVTMDDGKNYLVDVTNCDGEANGSQSIGYPDKLFLIGSSKNTDESKNFSITVTTKDASGNEKRETRTFVYDYTWNFGGSNNIYYWYYTAEYPNAVSQKDLLGESVLTLAESNYDPSAATTKVTPHVAQAPTAATATYGQTLANVALSGGSVVVSESDGTSVEGTWSWVDGTQSVGEVSGPTPAAFKAKFTPNNQNVYNIVTDVEVNVTVRAKSITGAAVTIAGGPFAYTGSEIKPSVTTVTLSDGTELTAANYEVSYSGNTAAGANTAAVTVTGKGNYTNTATAQFTIEPAPLTYTPSVAITVTIGAAYPTGGRVEVDGLNNETVNGTLAWYKDANHNTPLTTGGTFTAEDTTLYWEFTHNNANYISPVTGSTNFTVSSKPTLTVTVAGPASMTYGDKTNISGLFTPVLGTSNNGSAPADVKYEYAVTSGDAVSIGDDDTVTGLRADSATITITAKDSTNTYDNGMATVTITVNKKPITVTADDKSKVYGQDNPELTFTVPDGALVGTDTKDALGVTLNCAATTTSPAGVSVGITGTANSANYDVTVNSGTLTISRRQVTPTVTITPASYPYTGSQIVPTKVEVKDGEDVIDTSEYTLAYGANINVGEGSVIVTDNGSGNYAFEAVTQKFTITKPKQADLTITGKPATITYGDTFKLAASGGSSNETVTWNVTAGNSATVDNSGNVTITGVDEVTITAIMPGGGNYEDAVATLTFTPEKRTVTPSIAASGGSGTTKTYDGTINVLDSQGLTIALAGVVNDDDVTAAAASYVYDSADAGQRTVTASGITLSGGKKDNYTLSNDTAAISGTITKATVTITWGSETQSMNYTGGPAAVTAPTVSAENSVTVSVTPEYSYAAQGEDSYTPGLPANAGTYTVRASIEASDNLTAASEDMTLTINQVSLTISGATVTPKTYDNTTTASITGVTFTGLVNGETLTIGTDYTATGAFDTASAGKDKNVSGAVTLSGTTRANNYILSNGAFSTTGDIEKANSTITTTPTAAGITYGQALSDSTLSGGTGSVEGTFAWTDGTAKPNAGTAQYSVTFTPTDPNYNTTAVDVSVTAAKATPSLTAPAASVIEYGQKLSDSTLAGGSAVNPNGSADVAGKWSWDSGNTQPTETGDFPAAFTPADTANYNTPENVPVSVTVIPATPAVSLTVPAYQQAGKDVSVQYTAANPHNAALTDLPAVTLTYKIGDGVEQTITDGSFTIPSDTAVDTIITISAATPDVSGKYSAASKTAIVTVTDKTPVAISGVTVTGRAYNGKPIDYTGAPVVRTLDGETVTDAIVAYTWSSGEAPVNAGSYTLEIAVDDGKYIGKTTVDFTISKAAITITAADKSAVAGSAKPTLTYTVSGLASGEELATEPALICDADMDTAGSYTISASGAAVPNTENYHAEITYVAGTLTVTAKPSGGGGGDYVPSTPSYPSYPSYPSTSSTPSTPSTPPVTTGTTSQGGTPTTATTAAPTATVSGGTAVSSVTTTVGNEIVKQAVANGSTNVVIAPSVTGSVTKAEVSIPASTVGQIGSQTNASLTVSTSVADVTIPNGGLSRLSSAGGTVTVTAEQVGSTVELSVTAGGRTVESIPGGVTLTVPMSYTTPGTVAVLIHNNGTREVVRKSVADNGGVTILLDGSAKLEIVDNSKYFADVPATNWAADAVAFASSHELFNGTGANQFSPNLPMSRGMLATVLHNLENNPGQTVTGMFTDVGSNAWYAEGVAWAAANGIVTGYGNGKFGPSDNITREQLAVMLWRYAGSPAASNRNLYFSDAYKVSNWALDALCWATENGIINGKGIGILDPTGNATRAETAQMLKNFMENQ